MPFFQHLSKIFVNTKQGKRLLIQVVQSSCLEIFRDCLDKVLCY